MVNERFTRASSAPPRLVAVVAVSGAIAIAPPASALPTIPPMPDLRSFTTVQALTDDSGTYFRTTDGLHCKLRDEYVDCAGTLPGTPSANAISLGDGISPAGPGYGGSVAGLSVIDDRTAAWIDKFGDAAPIVRPGDKVVGRGSECAVAATDAGQRTMCTIGHPVRQWLVVSPTEVGIGPATSGLPAGYPEPVSFVHGYARTANNHVPSTFTVEGAAGELTCQVSVSALLPSVGCDGDLPGTDANEVFVDQNGAVDVVRTDTPRFNGNSSGAPHPRLPVGYRTPYPGTCLAIADGVACYYGAGTTQSPLHGFKVDAAGVTTF